MLPAGKELGGSVAVSVREEVGVLKGVVGVGLVVITVFVGVLLTVGVEVDGETAVIVGENVVGVVDNGAQLQKLIAEIIATKITGIDHNLPICTPAS
jgi:hypothetical protein